MAANDKWSRWEIYQKTGRWPETENQRKAREAKERAATEPAHPAASSSQMADAPKVDFVSEFVRKWHEANPGFRPEDFNKKE